MPNNRKARQKISLITYFLAMGLLPPAIFIFNKPVSVNGIPLLYTYIFLIWVLYIFAIAFLARKTDN
jgi:hypothetical protein